MEDAMTLDRYDSVRGNPVGNEIRETLKVEEVS
jgi:hypothetical protein